MDKDTKDTKEKSPSPSWWQTAPGILTAIAALITASGGFLIVLNQIGCFDKNIHKDNPVIQAPVEKKESSENNSGNKVNDDKQITYDSSVRTNTGSIEGNLPLPGDVKIAEAKIKFLELVKGIYSKGSSSLKIKFRVINDGTGYLSFDHYLFRFAFMGQSLSPEKSAGGFLDPKSSKDNEVLFIFPDYVDSAMLQITYVYDDKSTIEIPLMFKTK